MEPKHDFSRRVPNFTKVDSIYTTVITSLQVKLDPSYISPANFSFEVIHYPDTAYQILRNIYATLDPDQEHFILLVLNSVGQVRSYKVIASGGCNYVHPDPRIIFRSALLLGATRIAVAHNHPSGNIAPSDKDMTLTEFLVSGGFVVDIEVCDHIIYGEKSYTSIRQLAPELFFE